MKTRECIFAGALISLLVLSGCGSFFKSGAMSPLKILVYADTMDVATKVAALLEETPNILATPAAELKMLDAKYIKGFDVVALLPVKMHQDYFPADILRGLQDFVFKDGKSIFGMHDVLVLQSPLMYEIFGGSAEVFPTDVLTGDLSITVPRYSPVANGIPGHFTLKLEHPMRTNVSERAMTRSGIEMGRLFDMSYKTATGTTETSCAGWWYNYGKDYAFYFAPGHNEETRYNPYVIRIIINAAIWMAEGKKYGAD